MVEIRMVQLDVDAAAVREAADLLSPDERRRAGRFAGARDRRRFIVARASLRRCIGSFLGVRPGMIEFGYGAHGKPRLAGRHAGTALRFNVSHCNDIAALAFATGCEVGVDIEAVRDVPDAEAITGRFGSAAERRAWRSLAARDRLRGFFNWWTRKEAFVKARGGGLSIPLNAFDVSFAPGAPAQLLRIADATADEPEWSLGEFVPGPGLVGAFAECNMEAAAIDARN